MKPIMSVKHLLLNFTAILIYLKNDEIRAKNDKKQAGAPHISLGRRHGPTEKSTKAHFLTLED